MADAREVLHATVNERTALCDGRAIVPRDQMTDEQWRTWRCCPSCAALVEHRRVQRAGESPFVKTCAVCGVTYTGAGWRALATGGSMRDEDGNEIELRHCKCGNTLSREASK